MALKTPTKIPEARDTGSPEEHLEAARKAALDFEVLRVWKVNGALYTELENVKSGKKFVFTEAETKPQTQSEMSERAKQRPSNFNELSAREQWEVDKDLGILDWDGS